METPLPNASEVAAAPATDRALAAASLTSYV